MFHATIVMTVRLDGIIIVNLSSLDQLLLMMDISLTILFILQIYATSKSLIQSLLNIFLSLSSLT